MCNYSNRDLRTLREHVERHDVGLVFSSGLGYLLGWKSDSVRMTHASFFPWEYVPDDGVPDWFWERPPLIAVEVVGPYDRAIDLQEKVGQFLKAGTRQAWILWPQRREVTVRAADGTAHELVPDDELDGGDVLPGFPVGVADLFDVRWRR